MAIKKREPSIFKMRLFELKIAYFCKKMNAATSYLSIALNSGRPILLLANALYAGSHARACPQTQPVANARAHTHTCRHIHLGHTQRHTYAHRNTHPRTQTQNPHMNIHRHKQAHTKTQTKAQTILEFRSWV